MSWHCVQRGRGRPLVLLHGIGMSHHAWEPVMDLLAAKRRVLAFDLAGFGQTPPLPARIEPNCRNLAKSLGETLKELGIAPGKADIVGNSLGGLIALEAGSLGLARSVVGLSPSGLFRDEMEPRHIKPVFWLMRNGVRRLPGLSRKLLSTPLGRALLLTIPLSSQSWRMSAESAIRAAEEFAAAETFDQTYEAACTFAHGDDLHVPCTVAFGTRDFILTPSAQQRHLLPDHVRWLAPRGWGHVPTWDDPEGVARLILDATA